MDERFSWGSGILRQLVAKEAVAVVYDVGAGGREMKHHATSLGLRYTAFDISPRDPEVIEWNVEEPCPTGEVADLVIMLEVIEHLNNPWLGIRNIAAIVKPGGFLILSTPNPAWSDSRLSLLAKGCLTMFTPHDLDVNHHVFTPWKHVIMRLTHDNGFSILHMAPIGGNTKITASPFWGWKMPLRVGYRVLKVALEKMAPDAVGALYGMLLQKTSANDSPRNK